LSHHYPDFLERKEKDTLKSSNDNNLLDRRVDLISINITESSAFNSLASPIIQRQVLHRFYTYLSDGKSISYKVTRQILQLINEKSNLGKREKVLNLDKNISAIKIGSFLQLKKCTENITDIENTKIIEKLRKFDENDTDDEDDENDGNICSNQDVRKVDSNSEKEKVFDGLTYICDKVCYSLIIL
jgi:hypothetical protein